ncbi:hypothetical protein Tsubulata_022558 [Turnera subulata]|uniref:RNA helicase n=1 Tax=Turnera subulata TaxID=218843 RepID=A0A9Q0F7K2_9ROSI|nr:hypothetical protein Tsubulata_022558 [Turnera subulata]
MTCKRLRGTGLKVESPCSSGCTNVDITSSQLRKKSIRGRNKEEDEALELEVYKQGAIKTELCSKCQFAYAIKELDHLRLGAYQSGSNGIPASSPRRTFFIRTPFFFDINMKGLDGRKKNAKNGAITEALQVNVSFDSVITMSVMTEESFLNHNFVHEDKTEWELELGWIYKSITEDFLTGFRMHCRGWRSMNRMPRLPAFKGSATPINLSDRLNQVLQWALGSVEIFSRHSPLCHLLAHSTSVLYGHRCHFRHALTDQGKLLGRQRKPSSLKPSSETERGRGKSVLYGHRCHFRHALTDQGKLLGRQRKPSSLKPSSEGAAWDNIDEWKRKLKMLLRGTGEARIGLQGEEGQAHSYGKAVVFIMVPLLNYRFDLDDMPRNLQKAKKCLIFTEVFQLTGEGCNTVCHFAKAVLYAPSQEKISAISVSERVASERGESLGESVGYKVRLEGVRGKDTHLLFCSTGILLRRLLVDWNLRGITHIIVDEIHEGGMNEDFLLIVLKELLPFQPELKLILMSSTLDTELFSSYFGGTSIFSIPYNTHFLEDILEMTCYKLTLYNQIDDYGQEKAWRMNKQAPRRRKGQIASAVDDALSGTNFKEYSLQTQDSLSCWNPDCLGFNPIEHLLCHICENERRGAVLVLMTRWDNISALKDKLQAHPILGDPSRFLLLTCHGSMASSEQANGCWSWPLAGILSLIKNFWIPSSVHGVKRLVKVEGLGEETGSIGLIIAAAILTVPTAIVALRNQSVHCFNPSPNRYGFCRMAA